MVGFTGDAVADPVNFKVKVEYRTELGRDAQGAMQWSQPVVEDTNVVLTRTPEGRYAGKLVPARAGLLRVGIEASGSSVNGKAFSDQLPIGDVTVHRVVARFASLTEKAIPRSGSQKMERLEITARLNVIQPGEYEMRLQVDNSDSSIGMLTSARATLAAGDRTLTASIPAADIRRWLKDGPWTIRAVQIFRPEGNSFGDFVGTGDLVLKTAPYTRGQWE